MNADQQHSHLYGKSNGNHGTLVCLPPLSQIFSIFPVTFCYVPRVIDTTYFPSSNMLSLTRCHKVWHLSYSWVTGLLDHTALTCHCSTFLSDTAALRSLVFSLSSTFVDLWLDRTTCFFLCTTISVYTRVLCTLSEIRQEPKLVIRYESSPLNFRRLMNPLPPTNCSEGSQSRTASS